MPQANCIYCDIGFDPAKGQGDHIISVQFGEFLNARRFRGCCPRCNNEIGKSEEQLIRCGSESVILAELNPVVPKGRQRGFRTPVGAHGAPPPKHVVLIDDGETIVTPLGLGKVGSVDSLHIKYKSGDSQNIRLFRGMSEESLRQQLCKDNESSIETIHLQADKENYSWFVNLIKRIFPNCTIKNLPDTPVGISKATVKTELTVTSRYFRAIAKIGFHYYLAHSLRRLTGHESLFSGIRKFILSGTEPAEFVVEGRICFDDGIEKWLHKTVGDAGKCHIICLEDNLDTVVVFVKLFHGDSNSVCYRVNLGTIDFGWTYANRLAHAFVYDSLHIEDGIAGTAYELPLVN